MSLRERRPLLIAVSALRDERGRLRRRPDAREIRGPDPRSYVKGVLKPWRSRRIRPCSVPLVLHRGSNTAQCRCLGSVAAALASETLNNTEHREKTSDLAAVQSWHNVCSMQNHKRTVIGLHPDRGPNHSRPTEGLHHG